VTGPAATLYTIGHSSHPIERFVALLQRAGVELIADVRSRPYSRWAPHFQKAPLARALAERHIGYTWLGAALGGLPRVLGAADDASARDDAASFLRGIDDVIALARERRTALLCAEEDPARCHRHRLLAPALQARAVEVWHLRGDGRVEPARALDTPGQLGLFGQHGEPRRPEP